MRSRPATGVGARQWGVSVADRDPNHTTNSTPTTMVRAMRYSDRSMLATVSLRLAGENPRRYPNTTSVFRCPPVVTYATTYRSCRLRRERQHRTQPKQHHPLAAAVRPAPRQIRPPQDPATRPPLGPRQIFIRVGIPVNVVDERLGRASVAFTMQVYQRVLPGMQADAAATFGEIVFGTGRDIGS